MKIGFITPEYPHPKVKFAAGIATSIRNLALALVKKGVDVTVFVSIVAPPVVNIVANRNNICEGDTLFLSATAVSNIANNTLMFNWIGPNGFVASNAKKQLFLTK